MVQIKRKIYRIRLKLVKICNSISLFFQKSNAKQVNILSSPTYKNQVKEDLYLQKYLLKNHIACKILSWEDKNTAFYTVIRSVWGYHKHLDIFREYLEEHHTINPKSLVLDNMDKKKQYELLQKNHIPVIPTKFIQDFSDYSFQNKKEVIKPVISAGGDDTFLIEKEEDLEKHKDMSNFMVQPYIDSIQEGEISIIVLDGKIQYGVVRYPGVFTSYQKEKYLSLKDIPSEIKELALKIIQIDFYQLASYMRIDFVKDKDQYVVLEVELVDPDLFIEVIPSKSYKKEVYQLFVDTIQKNIQNNR